MWGSGIGENIEEEGGGLRGEGVLRECRGWVGRWGSGKYGRRPRLSGSE